MVGEVIEAVHHPERSDHRRDRPFEIEGVLLLGAEAEAAHAQGQTDYSCFSGKGPEKSIHFVSDTYRSTPETTTSLLFRS